jgi:hypothetical protein
MKAIIVSLFLATVLISCNKSNCQFEGTVIGADYRMCACCGGWFIVDEKGDTSLFQYNGNKTDLGDNINNIPYNIRFSYKTIEGACGDWAKEMTCYEILD